MTAKTLMGTPQPNEFLGQKGFASFGEPVNQYDRTPGRAPVAWSDTEDGAKAAAAFMQGVLDRAGR